MALETAHQLSSAGRVSSPVALLAETALGGSATVKAKVRAVELLLTGIVVASAGTLAPTQPAQKQAETPAARKAQERGKSEKKPSALTDRYGDPLPRGAIGRIGTTRFLHGGTVMKVAFSPDGKILAGSGMTRSACGTLPTERSCATLQVKPDFFSIAAPSLRMVGACGHKRTKERSSSGMFRRNPIKG